MPRWGVAWRGGCARPQQRAGGGKGVRARGQQPSPCQWRFQSSTGAPAGRRVAHGGGFGASVEAPWPDQASHIAAAVPVQCSSSWAGLSAKRPVCASPSSAAPRSAARWPSAPARFRAARRARRARPWRARTQAQAQARARWRMMHASIGWGSFSMSTLLRELFSLPLDACKTERDDLTHVHFYLLR